MLNQSKTLLLFKARLQVYQSIFESHLNFVTNVWSTNKNALSKLAPIQQKALKSVFLQPYRSHGTALLPALNLLKREQLITAVRVKFVHKSWNSLPFNLKSQEPQLFLGALQKVLQFQQRNLVPS